MPSTHQRTLPMLSALPDKNLYWVLFPPPQKHTACEDFKSHHLTMIFELATSSV